MKISRPLTLAFVTTSGSSIVAAATKTSTVPKTARNSNNNSNNKSNKSNKSNSKIPNGKLNKLPSTGEQWTTLTNGVEFQPAKDLSPLAQLHLRRLNDAEDYNEQYQAGYMDFQTSSYEKLYVDGAETYYDEYAQAWRALGWYIDCDSDSDSSDDNRRLNEDEEATGGCQRYLLWAAYIDEGYSGNGVSEYQYYDRKSNSWNDNACQYADSSRCVKMDCHETDTEFSLLGFFKEPDYDEWMEQLFKYEGDCVWDDDEYSFMQSNRESWPKGCTETIYTDNGNNLYYDLKPEQYGSMGIGLYTDSRCVEDYSGKITAHGVLTGMVCGGYIDGGDDGEDMCNNSNNNNNNDKDEDEGQGDQDDDESEIWSLAEQLETWNAAFDVYKQCQPCKAYDLTKYVSGSTKKNSTDYRYANNQNDGGDDNDEDDEDDDDDVFVCNDDASYDNVNQCMKFRTKTKMLTASWRDVEMAGSQGTITAINIASSSSSWRQRFSNMGQASSNYGKSLKDKDGDALKLWMAWLFLLATAVAFGFAIYRYKDARDEYDNHFTEPLVPSEVAVVA